MVEPMWTAVCVQLAAALESNGGSLSQIGEEAIEHMLRRSSRAINETIFRWATLAEVRNQASIASE
jgi:hypothetical protein